MSALIIDIKIESNLVKEPDNNVPENLIKAARQLRQKQTPSEELLWQLLRKRQLLGAKFRRQHPLKEGVILDFYCAQHHLAIEVDGGYHNKVEQRLKDAARTADLNERGILVIRFANEDVLNNTERVLIEITKYLK